MNVQDWANIGYLLTLIFLGLLILWIVAGLVTSWFRPR